ncbi:MAG: hypothetical protein QOK28_909 [Actinomycetota bacterium]
MLARLADEYAADHEARQAIMGLILRVVDEMRFGVRDVNLDDIDTLASIWSDLNSGTTPTEHVIDALAKLERPLSREPRQ